MATMPIFHRAPRRGPHRLTLEHAGVRFAVLLVAALILRVATFGNPNLFGDEAFYLTAGIEMKHGAVPFVDIWDRKPFGHFALFWAIAAVSEAPAFYQIVAMLFAAATAFMLAEPARETAGARGAVMAGLAYLLFLPVFSGYGGQSPVFYNALVAGAALLVLRARSTDRVDLAMLLAGLAITIKTTALFEGVLLGLFACWSLHRTQAGWRTVGLAAIRWAAIGAAPSLAIAVGYALAGYWTEFWQAMVLSNVDKAAALAPSLPRAEMMATLLAPLALLAAVGAVRWRGRMAMLLAGWTLAALLGLLAVPNFYHHYALPLAMPLAIAAAPVFARATVGPLALAILAAVSFKLAPPLDFAHTARSRAAMDTLVAAVRLHGGERGLLIYDGPPLLYPLSGTRPLSPLAFPAHLHHLPEADVSHLSTTAETRRILAARPGVVVLTPQVTLQPANLATRTLVEAYVREYCRPVALVDMPNRFHSNRVAVHGDCARR